MPTPTLALDVITAALTEQLARDADTTTIIRTVIALSGVIVRYAPNGTVRAAADGLRTRAKKLSLGNDIPRFVVRDMLEDFIQQFESRHLHPRI